MKTILRMDTEIQNVEASINNVEAKISNLETELQNAKNSEKDEEESIKIFIFFPSSFIDFNLLIFLKLSSYVRLLSNCVMKN